MTVFSAFKATRRNESGWNLTPWFAALGLFVAATLHAQPSNPRQILAAYEPDDIVVVTVYFSDLAIARRISITYEPRESNYEAGYLVLQEQRSEIERLLQSSRRLGFTVVVDQEATAVEQAINLQGPTAKAGGLESSAATTFVGIPGFACYRTVEETFATAEAIALNNPNLATWTDVGDTWEKVFASGGYDLNVLRLTNLGIPDPKPTVFITSAIHAREYTTAELMTRFAEQLVAEYGVDPDTTWILDHTDIRLMLVANPDGRKQAEGGLLWRKNTNSDYCGPTSSNRGADLNRNFPFGWNCCGGSSSNECSQTFRGASPASEPETQAVVDQLASIFPDARGPNVNDPAPADTPGLYLDIHSSGRLILWPWGFTSNPAPNGAALQTLGRKLAFFNGHTPQQSIGLYPTDGTTTSYGYGELGIASYTYELGTEFFESCDYFENTLLPDNIPSLKYALKVVRAPYLLPAGPEGIGISVFPNTSTGVPAGTLVNLALTFDDTRFNNSNGAEPTQNVVAAEYYVDLPPWEPGASAAAVSMNAADGSFDSGVEAVEASVDTLGLSEGRHIVYTRAQDSDGNWGPVSATFLDIDNNAILPVVLFEDDFESPGGWVTDPNGTDTATTGQWERADPEQTNSGGVQQSGTTVSGTFALVTGPLAGSSVGTHDVDNGLTSARSPSFAIPLGATSVELRFHSYLAHLNNATTDDFLRVSVVGSSSGSQLLFEETGDPNQDNAAWVESSVSLDAFAGESVYLLIEAADAAGGSLVEAALDDVLVTAVVAAGGNGPPSVDAGLAQVSNFPAAVLLSGTASDDGEPDPPAALSTTWSQVSGPGTATFADPGSLNTSVTFSASGLYTLRLTADDGELQTSDEVTITSNSAPTANAGPDDSVTLPSSLALDGTVADDGLPIPPGTVSTQWSVVSGPGTVTFADAGAVDTSASFSESGVYVLRLSADDSLLAASDDVQITVSPASAVCPTGSIDFGQFALESYSNQDLSGGASASADGSELTLTGNAWKRSAQSYPLTPNTVIEFEYASTSQGEIHGIGFDVDQTLNNHARLFQFWGTQNWTGGGAINYSPKYTGGGVFQSYAIPVGNFYSGSDFRLVFVNDKDSGTPNNEGVYRCVRIVEQTPVSCAIEEDFTGGANGWTNSPASTCATGSFVVGTPTAVSNGGVVTQVGGDHTSGSGNALFSAVNTSAGSNDIDDGECIAESPIYNVNADSDLSVWYFHGQRDAGDDVTGDFFNLELSLDGGQSWTTIAANGDQTSNAVWTEVSAPVPAGSAVQLRIGASDGPGPGDLIEAGLDDLKICEL